MKKGFQVILILGLIGGIGLACRFSELTSGMMALLPSGTPTVTSLPSQSPTSQIQIDRTSIIQTVIVQFTQTAIAAFNTSTPTPSVTPLPIATLTPSLPTPFLETPTPIFVSTYVPVSQPCYWAGFVADITYPDGSILQANQVYLKTWRVVNLGTCTWVPGDQLIFSQGDPMGAPDAVSLVAVPLPPGGVIDISVYLRSPSYPGIYRANFRMRAMDGTIFGTGSQATGSLWSQIRVIPCCIPTPYGKADLDIKAFSISPLTTYYGMPVTATFTIKNKGDADVGSFTVV